jgi:O-antigen/teichoic acid export membrane protein
MNITLEDAAPAVKLRPLRRSFGWALTGQAVYACCQWAMLIVLARLGTPAMVGLFALGFAVNAPIFMFANLQLRAVVATDTRSRYSLEQYLALQMVMTGGGLTVMAFILAITNYNREAQTVILIVALAKSIETFSEICYGALQQHEEVDKVGLGMMVKGPLAIAALTIGILWTKTLIGAVAGMTLAWLFAFIVFDSRFVSRLPGLRSARCSRPGPWFAWLLRPSFSGGAWRQIAWCTLPLGFVSMLVSLTYNIPRYFVEHSWGVKELGIFSALAYLSLAGNIVTQSIGSATGARLALHHGDNEKGQFLALILKLVSFTVALSVAGVLMTIVVGRQLVGALYGPEYAAHAGVLSWIVVATGIASVGQILAYALIAARRLWAQLPLFALGAVVMSLACFELVPTKASLGAAMAMVLGSAAITIACGLALGGAVRQMQAPGRA